MNKINIKKLKVEKWINLLDNTKYKILFNDKKFYQDFLSSLLHKSIFSDKQFMDIINDITKMEIGNHDIFETIGDRVLNLIVIEHLYNENKNMSIGSLTLELQKIVCRKNLNMKMKSSIFKDLILHNVDNIEKSDVYGDILEAIIGVFYINKGLEAAKNLLINEFNVI